MATGDELAVIMPSYREGPQLLAGIRAARAALAPCSVIVAAFGENRSVREAARAEGVVWLESPRANRGLQLQLGARAALERDLVFLHADCQLPPDAGRLVRAALARPGVVGGAFRLRFDIAHPVLALLGMLSRITLTTAFLGDQCLFCSRAAYERAGGFEPVPLFEDVGLAYRLAATGRLVRLPAEVTTSGRRFERHGYVRQLVRNALLLLAYHMGTSPERLHALYEPVAKRGVSMPAKYRRRGRRSRRVAHRRSHPGDLQS